MYSCCFNSFDVKDTNLSLPTDMWLWVGITLMCNFVTSVCYMVYNYGLAHENALLPLSIIVLY